MNNGTRLRGRAATGVTFFEHGSRAVWLHVFSISGGLHSQQASLQTRLDARITGLCWNFITEGNQQVRLEKLCCCEVAERCEGLVASKALNTGVRFGALVPSGKIIDVAVTR